MYGFLSRKEMAPLLGVYAPVAPSGNSNSILKYPDLLPETGGNNAMQQQIPINTTPKASTRVADTNNPGNDTHVFIITDVQ